MFMQIHVHVLNMYLHVGVCIKLLHRLCITMFSSAACGAFEHHSQFSEVLVFSSICKYGGESFYASRYFSVCVLVMVSTFGPLLAHSVFVY